MLKVTTDENGYVNGWCMVGDNGGIDVDLPDDLDGFMDCASGYRVVDGRLVLDEEKDAEEKLEIRRQELRELREAECFPVINRGWIWYSSLTLSQWRELRSWYLAWLKVTETLAVPERPAWLDSTDTSRIPPTPGFFL